MDFKNLILQVSSLTLFRSIRRDRVVRKLTALLTAVCSRDTARSVALYSDFVSALYCHTTNFSDYILDFVLGDENQYMLKKAQDEPIEDCMEQAMQHELRTLQALSGVVSCEVRAAIAYDGFLPSWENADHDFPAIYTQRIENIHTHGYGVFARHHIFTVEKRRLMPVSHPDETRLAQLSGYEYERKCVVDNTLALLSGKPAANVLLYGDSGTGKSSTVKAVANEFAPRGLRLIEIKKNQLRDIPALTDSLGRNPLKFILFIDDLSFTRDDDDFGALKAILEGSVAARTENLAVYATSNRRHLVRETFSDREGDEIHANDTVQQLTSLSDRFGLTITFSRPNKAQYLAIVADLAQIYDIDMQQDELFRQAEIYALERGGRSPRVAKQFLEQLQSIGG